MSVSTQNKNIFKVGVFRATTCDNKIIIIMIMTIIIIIIIIIIMI